MSELQPTTQKGFTVQEKWIIWTVFCMLVGLSAYRFSIFFGLLATSGGIFLFRKKKKFLVATALLISGLCSLIFSKYLI